MSALSIEGALEKFQSSCPKMSYPGTSRPELVRIDDFLLTTATTKVQVCNLPISHMESKQK